MYAALAALFALSPRALGAAVLYDGSLGNLPSAQGWLLGALPAAPSQAVVGGALVFDSTGTVYAGYARADQILDADVSYHLTFDLQIESESHASSDRAGFSLIVISSDERALELAFWENEIWAQNDSPLFTHGEGVSYDTTTAMVQYRLSVAGSTYTLRANGTAILTGPMRDYSGFSGIPDPYEIPNGIFFGDNTSSASASFRLARFEVSTGSGTSFYTLAPCRAIDTRNPGGPTGGPALAAGAARTFTLAGVCGIPSSARALSVNLAVTGATAPGHLRLHAADVPSGVISSINYAAGQTRSNNAIVGLDASGRLAVFASQAAGTVDFILDVNGYFE